MRGGGGLNVGIFFYRCKIITFSHLTEIKSIKNCKAFSSFSAIDHYTYKLCFSIHNIFANMFYEPLFRLGSKKGLSEVNF